MSYKIIFRITSQAIGLMALCWPTVTGAQKGSAFLSGGGHATTSPYSVRASVGELGAGPQQGGVYSLNAGLASRLGSVATVPMIVTNTNTLPLGVVEWRIRPSDTIP